MSDETYFLLAWYLTPLVVGALCLLIAWLYVRADKKRCGDE